MADADIKRHARDKRILARVVIEAGKYVSFSIVAEDSFSFLLLLQLWHTLIIIL